MLLVITFSSTSINHLSYLVLQSHQSSFKTPLCCLLLVLLHVINIISINFSMMTLSNRPLTSVAVTMTLLTDLWSIYVVSWILPPQEQEKLKFLCLYQCFCISYVTRIKSNLGKLRSLFIYAGGLNCFLHLSHRDAVTAGHSICHS